MKKLGLYIHIPFCESKCTYCDFNSGYVLEEDRYLKALVQEIKLYAPTFKNHCIDTIFFGGGTPSLYSASSLEKILNTVTSSYKIPELQFPAGACTPNAGPCFRRDKLRRGAGTSFAGTGIEITIECNPNSLTLPKLQGFKKIGFNRVSLGAQSFQDNYLKKLTRLHSSDHIREALKNITAAGFENFSFDLMYGLPNQDFSSFKKDLNTALSFNPPHFSFYNLTLEKNHPLFKELPSNETCTKMHLISKKILEKEGYDHYEISNFAEPGFKSRHNLKYWEGEEYLGLGAGASSYLKTPPPWAEKDLPYGVRFMDEKNPTKYINSLLNNSYAIENKEYLTQKEALVDELMGRLRLSEKLSLSDLNKRYHIDFTAKFSSILKEKKNLGLLDIQENMLNVTNRGRLFLNEILIDFI